MTATSDIAQRIRDLQAEQNAISAELGSLETNSALKLRNKRDQLKRDIELLQQQAADAERLQWKEQNLPRRNAKLKVIVLTIEKLRAAIDDANNMMGEVEHGSVHMPLDRFIFPGMPEIAINGSHFDDDLVTEAVRAGVVTRAEIERARKL